MSPMPRRVSGALRALLPALLALSALPAGAGDFTWNRNAAHIDWRTAETEHFRFHYPRELTDAAGEIAGIAESVAPTIIRRYNARLPGKVEFVVRDDIFSNGWANSLQNTMTVWATDWDFPIRSTHNWLRDVVTHEFAHLVSIQSGAKLPAFIQGVVVGYEDYYNAPVRGGLSTIIPFINQPAWLAEGVAQYESERAGFDAWDGHRDMLMRVAALEDKLLPIERMDVFAGTSLEYEMGPYTQGFALSRFIAARYGDDALIKLWAENSRIHRQTLSGSMERVLGKTDRQVHSEWKNEITARYEEQAKAIGTRVEGQKLTSVGFYNYFPRWNAKGDGLFFVSNGKRDDFRAGIRFLKLEDTTKKEAERLVAIPGSRGHFDVAGDDSTFLFSSAKDTDKNGMRKLDVYQRNLRREGGFFERKDPTEKRFTRDFNAVHASYSKDGKRITFVRGGGSNFRLYVAPVPEGDSLTEEDATAIFPPEDSLTGRFGYNLYTPKFSPDGSRILFSYFDGTTRNVGVIDADGKNFRPVLAGPQDERDPEWAPDGKSFYYVSDETGVYNIRHRSLSSGADVAVTNVLGGAFVPAVSPDGSKLAYSGYDKDGFSIYLIDTSAVGAAKAPAVAAVTTAARMETSAKETVEASPTTNAPPTTLRVSEALEARQAREAHPSPAVEALDLSGRDEHYVPVPTRGILTPLIFGQEAIASTREKGVIPKDGVTKWLAGASGYLADPVLKNELSGALLVEIGNGIDYFGNHSALVSPDKESQLFLAISNHATPVTLGLSFFRGNLASFDSTKNRDVPRPGGGVDTLVVERQDYALTFRGLEASAAYDLFDATAVGDADKTSFVRVAAGYGWNDFNFYDLGGGQGFAFTYFKRLYLSTLVSLYGSDYNDKGMVAPAGFAAYLGHSYSRNDLFSCTSNYTSDCFTFNNGALEPKYKTYNLHDFDLGATYGAPVPWSKNSALVMSVFASSVAGLPKNRFDVDPSTGKADSSSDFFERGLMVRGYPYLRDIENLALHGTNTVTLSADLNQPILPDLYRRWWILFAEDLYANVFWEAGRAWNGSPFDKTLVAPSAWTPGKRDDGWFQGVGAGLKLNARVYHNYPFLGYVEASRALSGIPDGRGGLIALDDVRLFGFDLPVTQVRFGVTFGLYNGLLGEKARRDARHPMNPRSPFASN
jgi:Tol biopolymer transport system component